MFDTHTHKAYNIYINLKKEINMRYTKQDELNANLKNNKYLEDDLKEIDMEYKEIEALLNNDLKYLVTALQYEVQDDDKYTFNTSFKNFNIYTDDSDIAYVMIKIQDKKAHNFISIHLDKDTFINTKSLTIQIFNLIKEFNDTFTDTEIEVKSVDNEITYKKVQDYYIVNTIEEKIITPIKTSTVYNKSFINSRRNNYNNYLERFYYMLIEASYILNKNGYIKDLEKEHAYINSYYDMITNCFYSKTMTMTFKDYVLKYIHNHTQDCYM